MALIMCSNYFVALYPQALADEYAVQTAEFLSGLQLFPYRPSKSGQPAKFYNLAPAVVREPDGRRTLHRARWGLLPHWAKTDQEAIQPSNVQAEGIDTKLMFRQPFAERRCLVPVCAFFEFKTEVGGAKSRYRFSVKDLDYFSFAGLYNIWQGSLITMTFATTAPTEWYSQYHHRQPAILTRDDYDLWLDPLTPHAELKSLLTPWPGKFDSRPESK